MNLFILDKGEVFTKADLSEVPKTKVKLKKRELAKARSKVLKWKEYVYDMFL